ncbi:MAG: phosphate propanoyltransferase [Bacteroidetes bacterium]|nr:phosphate propanoyltransferase [Bacteroidota bacterium]
MIEINDAIVERIAKEVRITLAEYKNGSLGATSKNIIPLGVSNRHIHLTEATFKKLFGNDTEFEVLKPLYQPGEFASKHVLTIVGPKQRAIQSVRILGPLRNYDQVEVSLSDAIYMGIDPPVANSGTLDDAAPLTLIGPAGAVYLKKCAIVASRHIHMSSSDAAKFGVKHGDYCKVRLSGTKSTIFENVLIRVNDNWLLVIHLDTDDANAANVRSETSVEFMGKMG